MSVLSRVAARHGERRQDVSVRSDDYSESTIRPSAYFKCKDLLGPLVAAILLIPAIPLIVLLVVIVRLTSRGPGIYRQRRVGKNGRPFMMYKIRTMREDAEAGTGPVWTEKNDARVTPVGRVLRRLHMDELPQLFNVLKGDMYLIGPRPERPEFVEALARQIPGYLDRLTVRPGITGLAQINLPPDDGLDCVCRKLTLDVRYIENAGPLFDTRMFFCTAVRLIGVPGETATQIFRLEHKVKEPRYRVRPDNGHDSSASCRRPEEILAASHNGRDKHQLVTRSEEEVPSEAVRRRKPR